MSGSTMAAEEARALSSPTRRTIVAHLADSDGPVTVADLTDRLELNHNAVRKHLALLVHAGLVREERETRTTPGRPRLLYALVPRRDPYRQLAVLLAEAMTSSGDPTTVGRAAAARRPPVVADDADPVDALAAQLAVDGFEPEVRRTGRGADIVLGHCPFADAAAANPAAVCGLHLGLAEGAAAPIGLDVVGLTARNPRLAGCRLAVTARDADV